MPDFCNLAERLYTGVGKYNIPEIKPTLECDCKHWIQFNYAKTNKHPDKVGVNFFIIDQQFERVWNYPNKYSELLSRFNAVLSPDFSLYSNFPRAVQIYNHYRKHWLAAYWQEQGITVIPTIAWSDEESFEFCFDGEPKGGIVAVSNVGNRNNKENKLAFQKGYDEMLRRLEPSKILMFSRNVLDYDGPVEYIKYADMKNYQWTRNGDEYGD